MKKIAFFGFFAYGHTHPTLEVVRELVSAGCHVRYYSFEEFRSLIEAAGAEFVPCDSYIKDMDISSDSRALIGKDMVFSARLLIDMTIRLIDGLTESVRLYGPDCIAADSMAIWGRIASERLRVPFVCSMTTFAFNRYSSKIMKPSLGDGIKMLMSLFRLRKDIKRINEAGFHAKSILDLISANENKHTIVYNSPMFQPCSETFPDNFLFAGPSVRKSEAETVKSRDTLVYISMGTVNNSMAALYRSCISSFGKTDYQVIISVGNAVDLSDLGHVPENIKVTPYADQISVLKKADVFVTHCGMNSANEGLYFGVPLVMLPKTDEQKGVSNRVLDFKAGVLPEGEDGESILSAVRSVLENPSYKKNAEKLSCDFRSCGGPKAAAQKIISLCR